MELVFVHGALVRDGKWWWRPAADLLLERTGIRSRAVALSSCGETEAAEAVGGLAADAVALRGVLDEVDSAVVVGHSYGGTVIAEAGRHDAIEHVLYVSSYLPDIGQSQGSIMGAESDPVSVAVNDAGMVSLAGYDPTSFGARFLQDAGRATQLAAWARVVPQASAAFTTTTSAAGWVGADSTYLVCHDDRSTSLDLQRFHAERATRAVELPTGHHPFISRPDLVVDQISLILRGS